MLLCNSYQKYRTSEKLLDHASQEFARFSSSRRLLASQVTVSLLSHADKVGGYIYIYIYIYICDHTYIYIYTHKSLSLYIYMYMRWCGDHAREILQFVPHATLQTWSPVWKSMVPTDFRFSTGQGPPWLLNCVWVMRFHLVFYKRFYKGFYNWFYEGFL